MSDSSAYAGGIHYRVNEQGKVEFLVIDYRNERRNNEIEIRFPGGGFSPEDGDNVPEDTLVREFKEELADNESGKTLQPVEFDELLDCRKVLPGHTKHFFLIHEMEEVPVDNPKPDPDVLGKKWMEAHELNSTMPATHPHRVPLGKAIKALCMRNHKLCMALYDLNIA